MKYLPYIISVTLFVWSCNNETGKESLTSSNNNVISETELVKKDTPDSSECAVRESRDSRN